jgi:CheY-like chemotaxis protein
MSWNQQQTPGKRILLVEADPDIRTLVEDVLSLTRHKLVCATDGNDCLDKLSWFKPQIILFNLTMPEMGGMDLAEELGRRSELTDTKLILFTSSPFVGEQMRRRALPSPKLGFIRKPFTVIDLLAGLDFMKHRA